MNSQPGNYDRPALRQLVPDIYLRDGWLDGAGAPLPKLTGLWATAAAEQFLSGRVAGQEVETTFEAFRQALPFYLVADPFDFPAAATEALSHVAGLLGQPNNPALVAWLEPCATRVTSRKEADAFMAHFKSALIQYSILIKNVADE